MKRYLVPFHFSAPFPSYGLTTIFEALGPGGVQNYDQEAYDLWQETNIWQNFISGDLGLASSP